MAGSWGLIVALGVLLVSAKPAWASAQDAIQANLPAGESILTAKGAVLAQAVARTVLRPPGGPITAADIAAAALEPVDGVARRDLNSVAVLVTGSAVAALISGTDAAFGRDVGAITDAVVAVNGGVARETLSTAAQAAVLKMALGVISTAAGSTGTPITTGTLLAGDEAIGAALAGDDYLETSTSLPAGTLLTILQGGMVGISGVNGKAQGIAPEAAEAFAKGLVSSTAPDGLDYADLAVGLLKKVSGNTNVDELVAYQIGLKEYGNQAELVALAADLFTRYPLAAVKVTQGVAAAIAATNTAETGRVAFLQALATAQVKDAMAVAQGGVFVDPANAGLFTAGVMNGLLGAANGPKLLAADAGKIATGVGAVLGQDADVLTQVAETFAEFTGSNYLPVTSAGTYAVDLIKGAMHGTIPVSEFADAGFGSGGGKLVVGNNMPLATARDLAAIVDVLANGILTADSFTLNNATGLNKAASEVETLVKDVGRLTGNAYYFAAGGAKPVASFLAGTLANSIVQMGLPGNEQATLLIAVTKGVESVTDSTIDKEVEEAVANYQDYPAVGAIAVPETTITNL